MLKLFGLLVVGLALTGCQINSHRYPGLAMLNELVSGKKVTGHDVLIVACANHPSDYSDKQLCDCAYESVAHAEEAQKRGLICSNFNEPSISSEETVKEQTNISVWNEDEFEHQKQTISNDTQIPILIIASADTRGKQGVIRGRASDNVGVAEVTVDGNAVGFKSNGSFEYFTFVPLTGLTVTVQATDMAGLSSQQTVSLQRNVNIASATISFPRLNPLGKRTR